MFELQVKTLYRQSNMEDDGSWWIIEFRKAVFDLVVIVESDSRAAHWAVNWNLCTSICVSVGGHSFTLEVGGKPSLLEAAGAADSFTGWIFCFSDSLLKLFMQK